jgi:hypothetical protein
MDAAPIVESDAGDPPEAAPPIPGDDSGSPVADSGGGDVPITFVQAASQDTKNSVSTASATYASPQHAGDLNVVVIGWSDVTHQIRAISDSAGNTYALATSPASASGAALAVYYASNITAGVSTAVTVDFDTADYPCLAILEYAGVSQLDGTANGSGTSADATTSAVTPSAARALVLGAGEPNQNGTADFTDPGAGFVQRVLTNTSGMLVEDQVESQVGSYAASGALNRSSAWVMQVVAFK